MNDQQIPTPSDTPTAPVTASPRWWRNKKIRLAITIIGIALIIVAKFSLAEKRETQRATNQARQEISSYLVGDCVALSTNGEDIHRADCATEPSFTVGAILTSDTPCAAQTNYTGYGWTLDNHIVGRLCLIDNYIAGHCYHPTQTGNEFEPIDCSTTTDKAFKIVQRLDIDDPTQCPPNTLPYNYPTPARTYCITAVRPAHTAD